MRRRRAILAAAVLAPLCAFTGAAAAEKRPKLVEGETIDPSAPPWTSIGRVNNSIGGNCTGVLVAADKVLTAAHCVYNDRTRRFLRAEAIHVLLGFSRGDYVFHGRAASYRLATGYVPGAGTVGADYAVIALAEPAPASITPLALLREPVAPGTRVLAVGYGRGRSFVPTVEQDCHVEGRLKEDPTVLGIDCVAPDGYSGGPLLEAADPSRVVGIQVARQRRGGRPRTLAIAADAISLTPGGLVSP
jgi:protease YdgD